MDVMPVNYHPNDPMLVDNIVWELKSQGIFDTFRKECIADVDTKPAYQNLRQRVEGSVASFLRKQKWSPDLNKNQLREQLRKTIYESGYLETGVERIVDQVVNPKMNTVFLPKVTDVVYQYLGLTKPEPKTEINKDDELKIKSEELLPNELEAVSPESRIDDKNDDSNMSVESMKIDEEESPPFEPLDEDVSVDSHMSGISGLQSHDSNSSPKGQMEDTQGSKQSSDGTVAMEIDDSSQGQENNSNESKPDVRKDDKVDKNKDVDGDREKKDKEKERSRSDSKSRSRSDKKYDKAREKDKYRDSKDKSRDKDKEREKSRSDRDKDKDRYKEKERDRKKDRDEKKYSSSGSSSKRDKDKDSSNYKSSSSSSKSSRDDKSRSRHDSSSRDRKTSSSRSDKDKDKDKDRKHKDRKDDHYSSKHKSERRSTDRDSNDGSGLKSSSSSSYCESNSSSQHSHKDESGQGERNDRDKHEKNDRNDRNESKHRSGSDRRKQRRGDGNSLKKDVARGKGLVMDSEVEQSGEIEIRVKTPPPSISVSAASWDALEAQLNSNVSYDATYYDSDDAARYSPKVSKTDEVESEKEDVTKTPAEESPISSDISEAVPKDDKIKEAEEPLPKEEEKTKTQTIESQETNALKYFSQSSIEKDEISLEKATMCLSKLQKQLEDAQARLSRSSATTPIPGVVESPKIERPSRKRRGSDVSDATAKKTRNNNVVGNHIHLNSPNIPVVASHNSESPPNLPFHLPLSPAESDSDKSTDKKADDALPTPEPKRRVVAASQRYSSDDLYKPRPVIKRTSMRRRGNLDND